MLMRSSRARPRSHAPSSATSRRLSSRVTFLSTRMWCALKHLPEQHSLVADAAVLLDGPAAEESRRQPCRICSCCHLLPVARALTASSQTWKTWNVTMPK